MTFEQLYARRFPEPERLRRNEIWKVLCRHLFGPYIRKGDTVLDLGAGNCEFINNVECARRIAVDVSERVQDAATPGVECIVTDARRLSELGLPPIDLVMASNIFEHVPTKGELLEILAEVHRILRSGGRLLITQPNLRYVGGEYWDFLDHHLPLTHRTMEEILALTGFEIIELRARLLPYTTKSLLPQHPLLVFMYLKCRPAHWVLGKQMFIVAQRP